MLDQKPPEPSPSQLQEYFHFRDAIQRRDEKIITTLGWILAALGALPVGIGTILNQNFSAINMALVTLLLGFGMFTPLVGAWLLLNQERSIFGLAAYLMVFLEGKGTGLMWERRLLMLRWMTGWVGPNTDKKSLKQITDILLESAKPDSNGTSTEVDIINEYKNAAHSQTSRYSFNTHDTYYLLYYASTAVIFVLYCMSLAVTLWGFSPPKSLPTALGHWMESQYICGWFAIWAVVPLAALLISFIDIHRRRRFFVQDYAINQLKLWQGIHALEAGKGADWHKEHMTYTSAPERDNAPAAESSAPDISSPSTTGVIEGAQTSASSPPQSTATDLHRQAQTPGAISGEGTSTSEPSQ